MIIQVQEQYPCSAQRLWKAISVHEEMIQWYFENIPHFEAVPGSRTAFEVQSGERTFTHIWKVLAVDPKRLLSYSWEYDEYPGMAEVSFVLEELDENSCRLKLSFTGLESFPQDVPEFTKESCTAGWKYFLTEKLLSYIKSESD